MGLGLNLGVSTPLELSEKYRFWVSHPKSSKSTVIVTVYQHSRKEMLGSDTTMGLSWRWNTVGCTVEPLDGYGWFLGSLTCYAPFSAGSDSLLPWKERREFPRGIASHRHLLCPRAMPSAPPCRARLELVKLSGDYNAMVKLGQTCTKCRKNWNLLGVTTCMYSPLLPSQLCSKSANNGPRLGAQPLAPGEVWGSCGTSG